jgi:Ion transport protein
VSQNFYFQTIVTLLILGNTVVLALDEHPEDYLYYSKLEFINTVFSIFFIFEMLVKLVGLGVRGYFQDTYNIFDCVIVCTSITDLLISVLISRKTAGVITALRSFRLLRLFKLAKHWERLHHLLKTIARTLKDVSTFSILLFIFMFCFALLGMELFAFRVRFADDFSLDLITGQPPDSNYDTLLNAFATVFIVLTADGWSAIYFAHYRAL